MEWGSSRLNSKWESQKWRHIVLVKNLKKKRKNPKNHWHIDIFLNYRVYSYPLPLHPIRPVLPWSLCLVDFRTQESGLWCFCFCCQRQHLPVCFQVNFLFEFFHFRSIIVDIFAIIRTTGSWLLWWGEELNWNSILKREYKIWKSFFL